MKRSPLTLFLLTFMLLIASAVVAIGTLTPQMQAAYALPLSQVGLFGVAMSAGGILALLFGARLTDRLNERWFSGVLMLGLGLSCLALCLRPPFALALAALFLFGVCQQLLMVTITLALARANGERGQQLVGLGHSVYGIGSFFAPLLCAYIAQRFSWAAAFAVLGGLTVLAVLAYALWVKPTREQPIPAAQDENAGVRYTDRKLWALCLTALCYMGHLGLMGTWLPMALADAGFAETTVGWTVSSFWIGIVVGRMLYSLRKKNTGDTLIIAAGAVIGGVCLTIGILGNTTMVWPITCALLGIATGAFLPIVLSLPNRWYPASAGRVTSLVLLSGTIGNLLAIWLGGLLAQQTSSMTVLYVAAALPACAAVFYAALQGRPRSRDSMV